MTQRFWIGFFDADRLPLGPQSAGPSLVLGARIPAEDLGANGVILRTDAVLVDCVSSARGTVTLDASVPFQDRILDASHRRGRRAFREQIAQATGLAVPPSHAALVFAAEQGGMLTLYHHTDSTEREMLALAVAEVTGGDPGDDPWRLLTDAFDATRPAFAQKAHLLSTRWAYMQWRPDMELERKYTFRDIPDTWALEADLFRELYEGRYPGFYPEPHMGIQVFDYENHLFEVTGPPQERGYISFIPQVDGRVTVKRKWFRENAELRREQLWPGEELDTGGFDLAARSRVAGDVRALPAFRRKRLDVNYESLLTGHVFGVYFDICTTVDAEPSNRFGQVEVEYCRTRTLGPLKTVIPEFEALTAHVHAFLERHGVSFQHDLYSKLDFARESADLRVAS